MAVYEKSFRKGRTLYKVASIQSELTLERYLETNLSRNWKQIGSTYEGLDGKYNVKLEFMGGR